MKKLKRGLILLVAVAMIFSMIPGTSFAWAETENPTGTGDDSSSVFDVSEENETRDVIVEENEAEAEEEEALVEEEAEAEEEGDDEEEEEQNITLDAYFKGGAEDRDGHYVKTVENNEKLQQFQYHVSLDVSKKVYQEYGAKSVTLTIPASILNHMDWVRENNVIDGRCDPSVLQLDTGTQTCYLEGSVVPKGQATGQDDWYYERVYNSQDKQYYYVITNNKAFKDMAANTIQFDFIYQTTNYAYQYPDYNPTSDETLKACASEPFIVKAKLNSNSGVVTDLTATADEVYIDNSAVLSEVKKEFQTQWEKTIVNEEGDDVTYLYLLYRVRATVTGAGNSKPTKQYELTFDDGFTGAFTNVLTDHTDDGVNNSQETFELVGYADSNYTDESRYDLANNKYVSKWEPEKYAYKYVLIRVIKPDTLYINYKLRNTVKVSLCPIGGTYGSPKSHYCDWSMYYHNTSPTGRFMIHKWGNNNYDAPRHSRTDAYGVFTAYQVDWGHQNNELDWFNEGRVDELNGFRFWIWYEGYTVKHTDYTEPHELTFSFEDQDIGVLGKKSNGAYHNTLNDETNFKAGKLTSNTYNGVTKTALDPDDYYFSEVDFYPEAQNATYDAEKEKWVITREGDPFEGDEPILFQAKFGSKSSDWVTVAELQYHKDYAASKAEATYEINNKTPDLADVTFGQYEGEKAYNKDTGFIIKFKDKNCVAYRVLHTNDHYYWMCNVKPTVNLKSSAFVKGVLSGRTWTYVENIADMNVYDKTINTEPDNRIFNFERDAESGGHLPNRIAADAAVTQNTLLNVNKFFTNGVQNNEEQLYRASWLINARGYKYAGVCPVGVTYPIADEVLNGGTFFDLLPRGADMDEDSIKVYKAQLGKSKYSATQQSGSEINEKYLLTKGTDYTVEKFEGTYNGHSLNGLTLYKITITASGTDEDLLSTYDMKSGYTVVFDTVSYYEDIKHYGNILLNAVAFEGGNGTTYKEWGFPDDPRKGDLHKNDNNNNFGNKSHLTEIKDTHPDKTAVLDAMTNLEPANDNYWFGYDFDTREVYYNLYNVSGLSKRVKLAEETTWGIKREVEPGGQYQYKIRYSTDDQTTVSDVILYDKIEGYVNPELNTSSEWYGTLNSMKFEPPRGTNPAVKYYISKKDEVVADDEIDLTDEDTWEEVAEGADLTEIDVKWVAVDTKGLTLEPSSAMSLILTMTAPDENTTNKVKPVTYNDSHDKGFQPEGNGTKAGADFFNVSNQTEVRYSLTGEVWVEKLDEAGDPIKNITFTLKGTSTLLDDEGNPAVVNMTATTDDEGHAIFESVPLSGDGSYTLAEKVPSGYIDEGTTWTVKILSDGSTEIDGEDKTGAYLVVVNKESTSLNVTKAWENADGTTTPPDGAKVTFTLYADGEPTEYSVELDGEPDANANTVTQGGVEIKPWVATFLGLPKNTVVNGETVPIEYTVQETGTWGAYTVSYGDGTTATYAVDGGTITNKETPTELLVTKAWKNADGTTTSPEDAKVTFTLYADGTEKYTVELDGTADTAAAQGGYESEAWKAKFTGLPKSKVVNDETVDIEYTVKETGTWPGYTVSYGGEDVTYAVDGGTITNTQETTRLFVNKLWKNADGTTTAPDGGKVTFTLYADGTEYLSLELDGVGDTPVADGTPEAFEEKPWIAIFENVPKYKVVDGEAVEIEYTVKETGTWPGYTVTYTGGDEQTYTVPGGLITNTQKTTSVGVKKYWVNVSGTYEEPTDREVTFTLFADGETTGLTVTVDGTADETPTGTAGYESSPFIGSFINLPKYKVVDGKEVEIKYTIKETGTWPGYTVSYDGGEEVDYANSGEYITNTQIPTELSVTKAWLNADGSTTPPEDAEVTFTLYADGEATNYTVTLDGEADTAVTTTGGYESEAWKATFIKLPKYKIVDGKETEIEYTVQETGTWPGYEVVYEGGETATYAVADGTITNKQITTEISGIKTWNDADFFVDGVPVDGYQRPESITINLLADGTVIDSKTVTEQDNWEYEFTDLPKYKIVDGQAVEIQYTIEEEVVAGYEGVVTGTDVDNTPKKDEQVAPTEIILKKVDELTLNGLAGAEFTLTHPDGNEEPITVNADGTFTIKFTVEGTYKLVEAKAPDGYQNPGTEYTITVEKVFLNVALVDDENAPGGKVWMWYYQLEADVDQDYDADTNTLTVEDPPELINIEGEKNWDDNNNAARKRPSSITVELYADGEKIAEQVVTSANNWKFTFTDLPKMKDGKEIVYTIGEKPVKDYSTIIEGFKITNKYEGGTGDEMNLGLWIGILAIAVAAIAILAVSKLIKKK